MEQKVGYSANNEQPLYMYILVNNDLKMGKGKIAGQVGHVVGLITEEIVRNYYTGLLNDENKSYLRYMHWKNTGHAKIILKASEEQIRSFIGCPETVHILDAGKTQIPQNSLTVLGFYPNANLKDRFKDYKLL